MVYFRKRLTPEVLGEINEMIVQDAIKQRKKVAEKKDDDDDSNPPAGGGNTGTLIVDATCAPSDIRFPQDVSLLDEARENAEQIIDILQEQSSEKKPRTYRNKAHKDSLKYMRSRKHTEKKTREAIFPQSRSFGFKHCERFTSSRSTCMTAIHIPCLIESSV